MYKKLMLCFFTILSANCFLSAMDKPETAKKTYEPPSLTALCISSLSKSIAHLEGRERLKLLVKLELLPNIVKRCIVEYEMVHRSALVRLARPIPPVYKQHLPQASVLPTTTQFTCAAFSPDSSSIVLGGADGSLYIIDRTTLKPVYISAGHTAAITCLAISTCGTYALTGSQDTQVRYWNLHTGTCLAVLDGHIQEVNAVAFKYTDTGTEAWSFSHDNTVIQWDLTTLKRLNIKQLSLPNNRHQYIHIVPFSSHVLKTQLNAPFNQGAAFNNNASKLVIVCHYQLPHPDSIGLIWGDSSILGIIYDLSNDTYIYLRNWFTITSAATFSASDTVITGCSEDSHNLIVWDGIAGKKQNTCRKEKSETITALAVSPDNKYAITGSTDGFVHLVDITRTRVYKPLGSHQGSITSIALAPNGRYALSADAKGTTCVWDLHPTLETWSIPDLYNLIRPEQPQSHGCTVS